MRSGSDGADPGPAPGRNGTGSRVDVRSLSRVGVGDLGVNARRVRAFAAALVDAERE